MRKFISILLLLAPMSAFASNPARFDLPVVTTTPAQVPVGSLPDLLAVTNATIAVCSYPATLSNGMCTNTITTYSDSTLSSACPSTAQLTANGTSVCISTTGLQGAFGFWYDAAVNTHMTYTVQTSWGTFGPYDILSGSSSGGPGTVTNFSAGNAAPLFTTSVSNSTSTPALSFTPSPFAAHTFYGNNGASTGTPAASLIGVSDWSPNAYVVGSGSAQAQTITLTPAATALTAGLEVRWLPVAANTAAGPTLNVSGLGPRSITKFGANDLAPGDLTTQAVAYAIYDGSRFQLQNPQTATTTATLPSGTTNQMLYYAASGTAVTPLTLGTNLSITGATLNATGGGTPAGVNGNPQINASGSLGAAGNVFYQQSGDTIASIETACSSTCTYVVTSPQTITLSASHTMSSNVNLLFYAAGEWTVNGAFTLSNLQVNTSSTPTQHFAGSSTVTFSQTQVADYADWFGAVGYTTFSAATTGTDSTAAFQAAVNALQIGSVRMLGMFYRTTAAITFKSRVGMVGPEVTSGGTMEIVDTSATGNIITATGATDGVFKYLTLARSVTDTGSDSGFYASSTGCLLVQSVHSSDSLYPFYLNQTPSCANAGGFYNDTAEWCDNSVTAPSGTPIGFYLDSANGLPENSITLRDDGASNHCGSNINAVGRQISGTAINDVNSYNFNTAGMNIGSIVNGAGATGFGAQDIHLIADTHDTFYTNGELIENMAAAQRATVTIADAWLSGSGSAAAAVRIINSSGIVVIHSQIKPTTGSAYYASGSDSLVLSDNQISETTATSGNPSPVELSGVSHSSIIGNSIVATSGNFGNIVYLTGNSTYNSVIGNAIKGVSTSGGGVGADAGSNFNAIWPNTIDASSMSTQTFDAGTSNGATQATPFNFTQNQAAAHVQTASYLAPNATYGAGCLAYETLGVAATTSNEIERLFGCTGAGSASNWYGWSFIGATSYSARIYPNASMEVGETTPAAGPANGIAVGSAGNAQIDGSGNISTAAVTAATSSSATNSPFAKWLGNYWNGTVSAVDTWTCNVQFNTSGSFTNPESDFTCNGSGSSGLHAFKTNNASIASISGTTINSFSTAGAAAMGVFPSVSATSGANQNSPFLSVSGDYWDGSLGRTDTYAWQDVIGTGTNPSTAFTLIHTGSTGGSTGPTSLDLTAVSVVKVSAISTSGSTPKFQTGTSSNSDIAGQLTLSSGTATYTFANTYTSAPICVATDTTATNAVKVGVTTTVLTVTGTSADVLNYICIGRN